MTFKAISLCVVLSVLLESCSAKNDKETNSLLNGNWLLEMNSNDIGFVDAVMTFEVDTTSFIAYTRKGADRDILGFWTSTLGRIFTDDFKNGSLLRITKGRIDERGDTLILSGIFKSAIGSYYFNGKLYDGVLVAELTNSKKENRGQIKGTKKVPKLPLSDYPAIVEQTLELTQEKIFSKTMLSNKEYGKFEKKVRKVAPKIQDDLEMVFAFFYYARNLPISHYSLIKIPSEEENETKEIIPDKQVFLEEKSSQVAYLKITSFSGTAEEMDSTFAIIKEKNYNNLIVDLRDNPGGSVAAGMKFATNIADTTFYGGVFLTQKWFAKHKEVPETKDYLDLPHFTQANYDLIIEGIHKEEGLCLKIIPEKETYQGNVFILTNKSTASTCEPIVYGFKQYKLATIVGGKTAGAMLNGELFAVSDGFSVIIPTADYYASDGYRIDQRGVIPDIKVESAKALEYVMKNLLK